MALKASEVLARNVKRIKDEKNLSSTQLAALANVSPSVVTKIESGKANPTLKKIEDFANALRIPVHELLMQQK